MSARTTGNGRSTPRSFKVYLLGCLPEISGEVWPETVIESRILLVSDSTHFICQGTNRIRKVDKLKSDSLMLGIY